MIDWSKVIPPEPPMLPTLSPRQIRLALYSIGITEEDIDIQLEGNPAGQIEWKFATQFKRDHPLLLALADALELPSEYVDALWMWASEL